MGRKIGSRVIEACKIVEQHGGCSSVIVTPLMHIEATNAIKFLRLAVGYGLLTVDREQKPHQYTAIAGWRELVERLRKPTRIKKEPILIVLECTVIHAIRTQPNSIWAYAQQQGFSV